MSWCEEYAQNDPSIGKASGGDQPITLLATVIELYNVILVSNYKIHQLPC